MVRNQDRFAKMITIGGRSDWVALVCDAGSVTALAVRGTGDASTLADHTFLDFDLVELQRRGRIETLEQWVAEHGLTGAEAHICFAGSGTVVQKLQLPPLSARNRARAVRTRICNYLATRSPVIDIRLEGPAGRQSSVQLLAAGVEVTLSRGVHSAARRAGLRVVRMTALADAIPAPSPDGQAVQLLIGERTTTIQLFNSGRLLSCRDVLLGRRDFVSAYERPILTADGPVTFTAQQAEELTREVGIPVGREDEIRPGVPAVQLWPTLTPVLQRLRREVEQSLAHSQLQSTQPVGIRVLGAPFVPGLTEFLADELQLRPCSLPDATAEAAYLSAFYGCGRDRLDLRPPEQRLIARLTRPAMTAGICALLVIFANSATPREAGARVSQLRPLVASVRSQLEQARRQRTEAQAICDELTARCNRHVRLAQALPPRVPVAELLKVLFESVPPGVELIDVQIDGQSRPAKVGLRASYQGEPAASVMAARWARGLSDSEWFANARVLAVSGSGRDSAALVEIEAQHE